ncbi:MAG: dTDP-4-dehydrorhamnose 3,5-epimerase [Sulfuricaulis sp.]
MKLIETFLPGVVILEPKIFADNRGFFFESYNRKALEEIGIVAEFVQDNHSRSVRNTLRGLHYQIRQPQGKLVRVIVGEVYDVSVDMRRSSPHFGKWTGFNLSADNRRLAWIPPGFAHGFLVLSEVAELLYKTTDYWAQESERCISWNDPELGIRWPLQGEPILSARDNAGQFLKNADLYP